MTLRDAELILTSVILCKNPMGHRDPETFEISPRVLEACCLIEQLEIEGKIYEPSVIRNESGLDSLLFNVVGVVKPEVEEPDPGPPATEAWIQEQIQQEQLANPGLDTTMMEEILRRQHPGQIAAMEAYDLALINRLRR